MKILIIALLLLINAISLAYDHPKLSEARISYYKSIKEEKFLEPSLKLFELIKKESPNLSGVAETYIGSLIMLKGKYAFWPQTKLKHVEDGIKIMDAGLAKSPNNIESLFIYGSTCHYLPFFLGKKSLAEKKLRRIIEVYPNTDKSIYDPNILKNALEFIIENIEISPTEERTLKEYIKALK